MVELHSPHTGCNGLQNSLSACHRITQDAFELGSRLLLGSSPRVLFDPSQDQVSQQTLHRIWVKPLLSAFESEKKMIKN